MLARLRRVSPRALLVASAVVLALSSGGAVVLHEMRPGQLRERDRRCPMSLDIPEAVHDACIKRIPVGLAGYLLIHDVHRVYRQLDALGALGGLSLLGAAALAARKQRLSRLRPAP